MDYRALRLKQVLLVHLDGGVEGFQQRLAHLQLGILVRRHVDLLHLLRHRLSGGQQLLGRHHLVQEAGLYRASRVEHLAIDHRAVERRLAQAVTGQLDADVVHGHADLHFVQADIERTFHADTVIGRQQDERTLGHGMTRAGDDDRVGVSEHASRQRGASSHQVDCILRARGHHLQVIAAGKNARLAGDDDDGAILFGAVEGGIERSDHVRRDGIDLAIAQGEGGDAVFELIADQVAHGGFPC